MLFGPKKTFLPTPRRRIGNSKGDLAGVGEVLRNKNSRGKFEPKLEFRGVV